MNKENQLRVAFTWPGNTWKSTVINWLRDSLSKMFNVSVYEETARSVLDKNKDSEWIFDMEWFQWEICRLENERVEKMKEDMADILLIDRTSLDWLVYSIFNLKNWNWLNLNQKDIADYDLVILFTETFKQTNTPQFAHYNDDKLVDLFRTVMRYVYGDKLVEFWNWSEFHDIRERILIEKLKKEQSMQSVL